MFEFKIAGQSMKAFKWTGNIKDIPATEWINKMIERNRIFIDSNGSLWIETEMQKERVETDHIVALMNNVLYAFHLDIFHILVKYSETNYVRVDWPDIQDYMEEEDYEENVFFDPTKNVWFLPEEWINRHKYTTCKTCEHARKVVDGKAQCSLQDNEEKQVTDSCIRWKERDESDDYVGRAFNNEEE